MEKGIRSEEGVPLELEHHDFKIVFLYLTHLAMLTCIKQYISGNQLKRREVYVEVDLEGFVCLVP